MTDRPPSEPEPTGLGSLRASAVAVTKAAGLVWRTAPGWTALSAALTAIEAAIPVASAVALKHLTDAAVAAAGGGPLGAILVMAAVVAGLAFAGHVAEAVQFQTRDVQSALVAMRFQALVAERAAAIDLDDHESPSFHDRLHLTRRDVLRRPDDFLNDLFAAARNGLMLAGLCVVLAGLHWSLPIAVVVVSLPEFLVRLRIAEAMNRFHAATAERERRTRAFASFLTEPGWAGAIRLDVLAAPFLAAFSALKREILGERRQVVAHHVRATILAKTAPTIALFAGMVLLAGRVADHRLGVGDMVMFLAAFQQGQESLRALLRDVAGLHEAGLFLRRFFALLEMRPSIVDPPAPVRLATTPPPAIRFEDVGFTHPGRASPTLAGIDLEIPSGAVVGLIGRNGAGKTTLVKLMTRLYEPDHGRILIDGRPIDAHRLGDLRRAIAVIGQDFARYPLTLAENVAPGAVGGRIDRDAVRAALERAAAGDLEGRLPRGLDTVLSRTITGGADLSLGEWQKVALARADLRGAPILVLDEPTSAMDARAEAAVLGRLGETRGGRSLLLVTHRLSGIRHADLVYVLDGGRIAECGDHAGLMARGGVYAELFETQARGYREG